MEIKLRNVEKRQDKARIIEASVYEMCLYQIIDALTKWLPFQRRHLQLHLNKANLKDLIAATGLVISLKLD